MEEIDMEGVGSESHVTRIEQLVGMVMRDVSVGDENVVFESECGRRFLMWYEQDCCARCEMIDVSGDVADLVGAPIVSAFKVTSDADEAPSGHYENDSMTWTFYKFATAKGYVTFRWFGSSNGYYSEEASFSETKKGDDRWDMLMRRLA